MKISVGSQNKTKVAAVRDALALYPKLFPSPEIIGVDVVEKIFDHPIDLEKTVGGAIERARKSFSEGCSYSFGLEGGLMEVPHTKTGYMEVSVCAIYDGKNFLLGLSPACEWPENVTKLILSGEADASQAFKILGLTHHEKLGAEEGGIIGMLTAGRMTREDFMKYSVMMAIIQLERAEYKVTSRTKT